MLFALPAFGADVTETEQEWDPDLPVEAQRETEEARSASRMSVSASFGYISEPLTGSIGGPSLGPSFAFSKPFYMGTRRRFNQFLLEIRAGAGWVPGRFTLLQMSPMWGTNFYFGPYVGLETRLGAGFAAQLLSSSRFGFSYQGELCIVVRPFKDDRMRIKLTSGVGLQFLVVGSPSFLGASAYLGAGFEMPF